MEKNTSAKKRYAISAITILAVLTINFVFVSPVQEANALKVFDVTPDVAPTFIRHAQYINPAVVSAPVDYTVTIGLKSGSYYVQAFNSTTSDSISQLNVTVGVGFTSETIQGFSCSQTKAYCVVGTTDNTHADRVFLVDVRNGVVQSLASGGGLSYSHNNIDNVVYVDGSICAGCSNQDNIYVFYRNAGAGHMFVDNLQYSAGSGSFAQSGFTLLNTYDSGFNIDARAAEFGYFNTTNYSVNSGTVYPFLAFGSLSSGSFSIINIVGRSSKCSVTLTGSTTTGDIAYENNTRVAGTYQNFWLVSGGSSVSTAFQIDNSCNIKSTISMSSIDTGNSNTFRSIGFSGFQAKAGQQSQIYVFESVRNRLIILNATSLPASPTTANVINTVQLTGSDAGITRDQIAYSDVSGNVIITIENANSQLKWYYYTNPGSTTTSGGSGTGGICPPSTTGTSSICVGDIQCNDASKPSYNLLFCVDARNPNGSALTGASESTSTSINNMLAQVGLVNASNTNIKTNGTGYILTGVTFGIMVAVFWLASGGEIQRIPTFIWMIATIGLLGLSTAFGWTDVTFLIIGILVIIALASSKILSTLEIGGRF